MQKIDGSGVNRLWKPAEKRKNIFMKKLSKLSLCVCVLLILALFPIEAANAAAIAEPNISSRAAVVIDFETGEILFERNADVPMVPASMTKAMSAFVVFEELERGNLTLDTVVTISENAARVSRGNVPGIQGNHSIPLSAGSQHRVEELLFRMLGPSSNGSCVAMAEHISGSEAAFAVRMNESAAAIGMWADFNNSHGGFTNHTTARSMGILVREFILRYPEVLELTGTRSRFGFTNTNQLLSGGSFFYQGADGFRTGTTNEAGFCLAATAERNGRRIVTVVMNAPSNQGRYNDTHRLLDFGFAESARRDAERMIDVSLNGEVLDFDVSARRINGYSMAPIRTIFEALGVISPWLSIP